MYEIREAKREDLPKLLELYLSLHESSLPDPNGAIRDTWDAILKDQNHHVIVCQEDDDIVSSCVCVVIPNLTRGGRPYALIENVVTKEGYRKRGLAGQCLARAREIAKNAGCYKIMLLTGSRDDATHRFYQQSGYNNTDKTAYIQWL